MNDLCRQKLDEEIARLSDKLATINPESDEYEKISKQLVKHIELANDDDELRNKLTIEQDRIDAEATIDSMRRGIESEKLEHETRMKDSEAKRTMIQVCITAGVTLVTFLGTWIANSRAQYKSEYFESNGHAYTSRFARWQNKEPNHPNPTLKR